MDNLKKFWYLNGSVAIYSWMLNQIKFNWLFLNYSNHPISIFCLKNYFVQFLCNFPINLFVGIVFVEKKLMFSKNSWCWSSHLVLIWIESRKMLTISWILIWVSMLLPVKWNFRALDWKYFVEITKDFNGSIIQTTEAIFITSSVLFSSASIGLIFYNHNLISEVLVHAFEAQKRGFIVWKIYFTKTKWGFHWRGNVLIKQIFFCSIEWIISTSKWEAIDELVWIGIE